MSFASTPRSIFKNTVALFIARVVYLGSSTLLVYYLSRMLRAEGLGSYSTAMALFGLGELVCELGLSNFLPRELAKDLSQTNRYLVHTGILVLISSLTSMAILFGLASHLGYSAETITSVYLVSLALTPTALNAMIGAIFICHQRAEFVTFTTLFWTILRVLVSLYFLHQGHSVISLVAAFTGTSFLSFFTNLFFYTRHIDKPRWEFNFSFLRDMVRDLRTFVVLAIGGSLFTQSETIILSLFRDEAQVGFYNAAYKLITVWYIIPASYMSVVFPMLTQAYQQSLHKSRTIQEKSIKYLLAVALPLAVGGFAVAHPVIDLFYGPGFEEAVAVFRVIAWHTVLAFINNVLWRVLLARDEQRLALRVQVISGIVRIGLSLFLAPMLGCLGAAWALMGGYVVYTLLHIYYVRRGGTPLSLIRLSWRFAVASAIMGALTMALVQQLNLFVVVLLAAVFYAVSVLLLHAFSKEDWALFRQIWQRGSGTSMIESKAATLDL